MKKISICVPCYNEERNIELMYQSVLEQMKKIPQYDYEIIFADNCSTDSSEIILRRIADNDNKVKVILNSSNFGPTRSGINLLKSISGDCYLGIPCDFQEPPEMIPDFVAEWEKGYDVVWGQKTRSRENPIKYACRNIFYSIIKAMSDYPEYEQVTGFGIMDKSVVDILLKTELQDPYYSARNLVSEYGFNIKLIPYEQRARERGKSSFDVFSYFRFAITSLCNTSTKPLALMTVVGLLSSAASMFVAIFYFVYKIIHWDEFDLGMAPIVIGMFFVASIQLLCIGILGEYVTILLRRITKKELVIEKERINF